MKKANRPSAFIATMAVLATSAILAVTFVFVHKTELGSPDTPAVHVIHDADYYTKALIADRAVIPGLPSDEEIESALTAKADNPEKLAELFTKTANAYTQFAGQTKNEGQISSSYEKYAYYTHLAGVVYQHSLHDNETACWYYGGALSAVQNNPLYRASYASPSCQPYRHK